MDELRKTTYAAVAVSFTLICILLLFVLAVAQQPKAEVIPIVMFVCILALTYSTIPLWIRCTRKYVDVTIDRKLTADTDK